MQRTMFLLSALVLVAPPVGHAQSNAAEVAARSSTEAHCVSSLHTELGRWTTLLRDLGTQLSRSTDPAARAEIADSIVVVEERVRDVAERLVACVPSPTPPPETVVEPAAPQRHVLSENLRVDAPSFSGRGRLDPDAVHRALLPFGRSFEVCYDQLADRHAIVRGTAALRFEVRADGTIGARQVLDLELGDAAFQRCVRDALPRIESPGRPSGGAVTVDLMLVLGPES